jgi:hypothetical protein
MILKKTTLIHKNPWEKKYRSTAKFCGLSSTKKTFIMFCGVSLPMAPLAGSQIFCFSYLKMHCNIATFLLQDDSESDS